MNNDEYCLGRSGGPGVAGSNPAVPTIELSPTLQKVGFFDRPDLNRRPKGAGESISPHRIQTWGVTATRRVAPSGGRAAPLWVAKPLMSKPALIGTHAGVQRRRRFKSAKLQYAFTAASTLESGVQRRRAQVTQSASRCARQRSRSRAYSSKP